MGNKKKEHLISVLDDFKVFGLPYKQGRDKMHEFTMYIFLPDAKDGLLAVIEKLASESSFLSDKFHQQEVRETCNETLTLGLSNWKTWLSLDMSSEREATIQDIRSIIVEFPTSWRAFILSLFIAICKGQDEPFPSNDAQVSWPMVVGVAILIIFVLGIIVTLRFWFTERLPYEERGTSEKSKSKKKKNKKKGKQIISDLIDNGGQGSNTQIGNDGLTDVTQLTISEDQLGLGSNDTVIYGGTYGYAKRPVAVKKIINDHHKEAIDEMEILMKSDSHENIIRFFDIKVDNDFHYIILEKCDCNLGELIRYFSPVSPSSSSHRGSNDFLERVRRELNPDLECSNGATSPLLMKLLKEIVAGLRHLHELNIIHGDITPENILVVRERNTLCIRIADMGISRALPVGQSSLAKKNSGMGSVGWMAPEVLSSSRQKLVVDSFSLGCLIFFCLTSGGHPFDPLLERQKNIMCGVSNISAVQHSPEAFHLIEGLLEPNVERRLTLQNVSNHPFFWNPKKCLDFLREVSERLDKAPAFILNDIQLIAVGKGWTAKLDAVLLNQLIPPSHQTSLTYNDQEPRDLIKAIRNKYCHYGQLTQPAKRRVGRLPMEFYEYFRSRFPSLLIEVYKVISMHCKQEQRFRSFFTDDI
ncbi:serine/threonine-protein kinase/endoribonuclease IRE1-like [Lotus japonicus]|uniref:serine/threonine-protein kinase/endoribonuclease IRE1-like n=1 Tax=Lotus japonicus TaxID=34305 RepID=UPI002582B07D|nr:serine/threonine-protein kinase/endoribonuclease IRE1-like [Lotus japonicus]